MDFVVYNPQQLVKTSFGLLEPQGDLEVVDASQMIWFMFLAWLLRRKDIGLDTVEVIMTAI